MKYFAVAAMDHPDIPWERFFDLNQAYEKLRSTYKDSTETGLYVELEAGGELNASVRPWILENPSVKVGFIIRLDDLPLLKLSVGKDEKFAHVHFGETEIGLFSFDESRAFSVLKIRRRQSVDRQNPMFMREIRDRSQMIDITIHFRESLTNYIIYCPASQSQKNIEDACADQVPIFVDPDGSSWTVTEWDSDSCCFFAVPTEMRVAASTAEEAARRFCFNSFMNFEVARGTAPVQKAKTVEISDNLRDSFNAELTPKGKFLRKWLYDEIRSALKTYKSNKHFAPMTSICQSSGTGKSKLCTELLKTCPGLYFVFRGSKDSGYPRLNSNSTSLINALSAEVDDSKDEKKDAFDFCVGRIAIVLHYYIMKYIARVTEEVAKKNEGIKSQRAKDANIFAVISNFATEQVENKLFSEFSTFASIGLPLKEVMKSIDDAIHTFYHNFSCLKGIPFLLVFDEANKIGDDRKHGKLDGFRLLGRVLHCVNTAGANIFALAIATNAELNSFHEDVHDDSMREPHRPNLFPPILLSRNWDIFWRDPAISNYKLSSNNSPYASIYDLNSIPVNTRLLLNPRYEQLLRTLGRPIWASLEIDKVYSTAMAKLRNGSEASGLSWLAVWMVRCAVQVAPIAYMSQHMIKSLMAVAYWTDPSGKNLLIGYPSDPVLAQAARQIICPPNLERLDSYDMEMSSDPGPNLDILFSSIAKFFNGSAVDGGRIGEAIACQAVLLALDRAPCVMKVFDDTIDELHDINNPQVCMSYILDASLATESSKTKTPKYSHIPKVVQVRDFLQCLYGKSVDLTSVPERILDGFLNATHFIPLRTDYDYGGDKIAEDEYGNVRAPKTSRLSADFVIDSFFLRSGLLRQCGFVMPPSYPGIDFILPVLIEPIEASSRISTRRRYGQDYWYSYLSFQIRTGLHGRSFVSVLDEMAKMQPRIRYRHCGNHVKTDNNCPTCAEGAHLKDDLHMEHLAIYINIGEETSPPVGMSDTPKARKDRDLYCFDYSVVDKVAKQRLKITGPLTRSYENLGVDLVHSSYLKRGTWPRIVCLASFGTSVLEPFANHPGVRSQINAMVSQNRDVFASMEADRYRNLFADSVRGLPLMYTYATDLCREAYGASCIPIQGMTAAVPDNTVASTQTSVLGKGRGRDDEETNQTKKSK